MPRQDPGRHGQTRDTAELQGSAGDARDRGAIVRLWEFVRDYWAAPAPQDAWTAPPLQVCPLCGATERATREITARSGLCRFGRAQVSVRPVFTFGFCRMCAVKMVRECWKCHSIIRDEHATCCWHCGRAYPWARLQRSGDWRHFAEVIAVIDRNGSRTIWLYVGDITSIHVDGVVSPDDYYGRMRGEVANRILQAAGDAVGLEVGFERQPGQAWGTEAGNLTRAGNVRRIIHVAAMQPDGHCDPAEINNATNNALEMGKDLKLHQVAFPAIGTGSGGLEMNTSVPRMLAAMKAFLGGDPGTVSDIVCVVLDYDRAAQFKDAAIAANGTG